MPNYDLTNVQGRMKNLLSQAREAYPKPLSYFKQGRATRRQPFVLPLNWGGRVQDGRSRNFLGAGLGATGSPDLSPSIQAYGALPNTSEAQNMAALLGLVGSVTGIPSFTLMGLPGLLGMQGNPFGQTSQSDVVSYGLNPSGSSQQFGIFGRTAQALGYNPTGAVLTDQEEAELASAVDAAMGELDQEAMGESEQAEFGESEAEPTFGL